MPHPEQTSTPASSPDGEVATTNWLGAQHTPATRRIQARLERMELEHLRQHAAEQAAQIEALEGRLWHAEGQADYWNRSYHDLAEHFDNDTDDARAIGLTKTGELLVVRTEARA
jgi:hypothetical protein